MRYSPTNVPVTMHYCVRDAATDPFADRMRELCAQVPNVSLHVHDASRADQLDAAKLLANGSPRNGKMDVWFCGPVGFAQNLKNGLRSVIGRGLRMHREAFNLR